MRPTHALWALVAVAGLLLLPRASQCFEVRGVRESGTGVPATRVDGVPSRAFTLQDPATGVTWRVESDPVHPGGPGRLVRTASAVRGNTPAALIREGDKLRISQDTSIVHADLEATALNSGSRGDSIRVRLRFAGRVVRARITSWGRAVLIGDPTGVHR